VTASVLTDRFEAGSEPYAIAWVMAPPFTDVDASPFYADIEVTREKAGRSAIAPEILIALWIQATLDGISSARELDRRCDTDLPYLWICGGVSVNYHTLNDFRVAHSAILDEALTMMLAVLVRGGVVKAERISHDGMRVRASAGSSSFRKEETLEKLLPEARAHVERLKKDLDGGENARQRAATLRAARERQERLEAALAEIPALREAKEKESRPSRKNKLPRASTTDADARVMKMADGGFRPAYNVQVAVDTASRAIVGLRVTNRGTDAFQSEPMLAEVEKRTGIKAKEYLADGGYRQKESIESGTKEGVTMYVPLKEPRKPGIDPHARKPGDSEAIAQWRKRMGEEEAKEIYKQRGATVETVNGDLREKRGLDRINVRGLGKAQCVALWSGLAYMVVMFSEPLLTMT
jgi:transposase